MNASVLEIAVAFSILVAINLLSRPIIGYLADKLGRKPFITGGSLLRVVSLCVFAISVHLSSMTGVIVARALQGLTVSLFWVSCYALVADETAVNDRGKAMGRLNQSAARGALIGAFIGFYIASYSLASVFVLYAAIAGMSVYYSVNTSEIDKKSRRYSFPSREPLIKIVLIPIFFGVCIVSFIDDLTRGIIGPFTEMYLMLRYNVQDLITLATFYMPVGVIYSLMPERFGKLSDKYGRAKLIFPALVVSPLVLYVLTASSTIFIVVVMWALYALAWSAADTCFDALIGDITGAQRGTAYGLYTMIEQTGAITGPLIGSLLWSKSMEAPFHLSALLLLISIPIFLIFVVFSESYPRADS